MTPRADDAGRYDRVRGRASSADLGREGSEASMEFRLLGPVGIWHDGERLDIGRAEIAKARCLLAVLLRTPGVVVTTEALTERVWGARTPTPATRYKYVGWLRSALAPHGIALVQRPEGYLLRVDPEQVDLHRFRTLMARARTASTSGATEQAVQNAVEGLRLWRGRALTGLTGSWIELFRHQLEQARRDTIVLRVRAELQLGDHRRLLDELAEWEIDYPTDEEIVALRMLALYRCGQQDRALACYWRAQERIRASLDTEVGPRLQALQRRIQMRDAALDDLTTFPPPDTERVPPRAVRSRSMPPAGSAGPRFIPEQDPMPGALSGRSAVPRAGYRRPASPQATEPGSDHHIDRLAGERGSDADVVAEAMPSGAHLPEQSKIEVSQDRR